MSEDLDALLGVGFTEEMLAEAEANRGEKHELALPHISVDEMKDNIIANTADVVAKTNEAVSIALQDLQTTPNDPLAMKGVSDLIGAYTGLLA